MYKILKLTLDQRVTIPTGAIVELPVKETVEIPVGYDGCVHGEFYLRKGLAKRGLDQRVHTPFPSGWKGKPLIVVKNDDVAPIELRAGDEIGEIWVFE